jgi:hypothetical protein
MGSGICRAWLAVWSALVMGAVSGGLTGCNPGHPGTGDGGLLGGFRIQALPEAVAIMPNASRQIVFVLLDGQDQPVPERVLQFTIVDPARARGATLSLDRGVTNQAGEVTLQVIAGEATAFILRASGPRAPDAEVVVIVDPATHGTVEVIPEFLAAPGEEIAITSVRLFFVTRASCAEVSREMPENVLFPVRIVAPGTPALYPTVSTEDQHAVVGHGLDASGAVRADACVDLPGRAVLTHETVRLLLPLRAIRPSVAGVYRAISLFQIPESSPAVAAIREAWTELSACPFDPARIWLDCTVDALHDTDADDPLDCQPSAADDRAFDGRLAARRGLPLSDAGAARCRGPQDGAGRVALEVELERLFGMPQPPLVADLPKITREATDLLRTFRLHSTLEVTHTIGIDRYQIDHRLDALEFTIRGAPVTVSLFDLGLPARLARFVSGRARGADLELASHGFTLRLGTAARTAFERGSLGGRGIPPAVAPFVTAIFSSVSFPVQGRPSHGCYALSDLVCPLIGGAEGCLLNACTMGLSALARKLERAFALLDGEDLDLLLEGSAPIVDRDGDRRADALGWLVPNSSLPGFWSGELRTPAATLRLPGIWTADRAP